MQKHRLLGAAVVAGCLLAGAGPAAAVVPGSDGAIVTSRCEDGDGSCAHSHIWTIDPASGAERPITTDPSSWDDDPAVSPDGERVAFQRCPSRGKCRIAVVGIGGGGATLLTAGTAMEDYPAFSPDGSRLVFSRAAPSGGTQLVVMDAAGGDERPLTSGTAEDSHAAWSPDGSTIAFERREAGLGARIHTVSASGGPPAPLTAGPGDHAPSFSPDGSQIVFAGGDAVQIMDASGGGRHALTAPGANLHDGEPVFAPDGGQIVFERYSETVPHASPLVVINADGSDQHAISGPYEVLFRASWQPARPAADHRAPAVTLGAPGEQSVRDGLLYLFATSDESATGAASGDVTIPALGRRYRLRPAARALSASTRTRIRVRIPRKPLRAIRAALARHEQLEARIAVGVSDGAGNATTRALTIRLKN